MNVGDHVVFPWGQRRMVEGVIEGFDGPKAQVSIVKSKGGQPIWINKALLRKVLNPYHCDCSFGDNGILNKVGPLCKIHE